MCSKAMRLRPPTRSPAASRQGLSATQDRVAQVLQRITAAIVSGTFPSGAALPSEGSLAKSHGVSRIVMREAMRILRAQGLIEMSKGRRPHVRPPDLESAVAGIDLLLRRNHTSLLNLVEARRPLESEIAALAAERANDEHIRQLEQSIHELASSPGLPQRIEADVRFHRVLAEATGNPVFVLLLQALSGFLSESRSRTLSYSGVDLAVAGHRAVLVALRARDANAARAAMLGHLSQATRDLKRIHTRRRS